MWVTQLRTAAGARLLGAALVLLVPAGARAAGPAERPADLSYPDLPEFAIPEPEQVTLPNGLQVLMLPDRELPLVEGVAYVDAGSRREPAGKVGLASLAATVMRTGGTARLTGDEIDDLLEGIGARIESGADDERARVMFSTLARDLDQVLGVFAGILRQPAFAADKLEVAQTQARADIARRNDNVQGITSREFNKLVYGPGSVYARQAEYATIDAVGRDDLVAWHRSWFHPNGTILGLTGDFDPKQVRALVEKHFGDWPKGPEAKPFGEDPGTGPKPGVYLARKQDVNQANVAIGHLGIRTDNPDYFAVSVLNEVFGGGFSARLFSNVRSKKGLAYSVWGVVGSDYDHPGTFRVNLQTKSGTAVEAIEALREEIDSIRAAPPSEAELARAKESILNSFVFNFDEKDEVLERQMTYRFFGYPLDFLDQYRRGIEAVTAEDVHRVARAYMHPDRLVQLVVGKPEDFDRPLDTLGKVTELDISIPPPAARQAPEATAASLDRGRAVVARAVEAMGGADALRELRRLRAEGTSTVQGAEGAVSLKTTLVAAGPDRVRQDMVTPGGQMTLVATGEGGHATMGAMGSRDLPAAQRDEMLAALHRMLPLALGDPGLEAQHLGAETLAATPTDKVLVRSRGIELTLWVDEAGRVVQDRYAGHGPGGAPGELVRSYGDWRKTGKLTLPHQVETTLAGKPVQTQTWTRIEVNPAIDDTLFARPAQ